nr:hypothetical protein [Lacticaseibacillus nasuensis]
MYTGGPDQPLTPLVGGQRHITDWAVGPDQREVVFTSSNLTTPSQLRVFDLVSEEETLLYDPNARYARTHDLVAPSEFSFERAGYTIQAGTMRQSKLPRSILPCCTFTAGRKPATATPFSTRCRSWPALVMA